jgi:hypothetical protein
MGETSPPRCHPCRRCSANMTSSGVKYMTLKALQGPQKACCLQPQPTQPQSSSPLAPPLTINSEIQAADRTRPRLEYPRTPHHHCRTCYPQRSAENPSAESTCEGACRWPVAAAVVAAAVRAAAPSPVAAAPRRHPPLRSAAALHAGEWHTRVTVAGYGGRRQAGREAVAPAGGFYKTLGLPSRCAKHPSKSPSLPPLRC